MQSKAATVEEYLKSIPEDRRQALEAVRAVLLKNLDKKIEEGMQYGMIGYYVPHSVYPKGYHCDAKQPLPYAGLASQKGYMALYLMSTYCGCYGDPGTDRDWFQSEWLKTGKKLDMGKSCIRFKKVEDLPLSLIGKAVKRVSAAKFIEFYEAGLAKPKQKAKKAK